MKAGLVAGMLGGMVLLSAGEGVEARAERLIEQSRYAEAVVVLLDGLAVEEPSQVLLRRLAWVEQFRLRDASALALLGAARDADPTDPETAADLAQLLVRRGRFPDALAVLAEGPDPGLCGRVGAIYRAMGLHRLATAAFGDRHALTDFDRALRRRSWWRSGGPLRFLGRRGSHPRPAVEREPAPDLATLLARVRTSADQERVAGPALARADELQDREAYGEAVDVLVEALSSAGPNVALLRRLALCLGGLLGYDRWIALVWAAVAATGDTESETTVERVGALVRLGRFRAAFELVRDLPEPARRDWEVRAALAEVLTGMGLPALALDAYGHRRMTAPSHRGRRRALWWRTGGPLWWMRRRLDRAALAGWPADPPRDAPTDPDRIVAQVCESVGRDRRGQATLDLAQELFGQGEEDAAAALLTGALASHGPDVALLRKLAWVDRFRGRPTAALAHLRAARSLDPADLDVAVEEVSLLTELGRFRAALARLDELPEADRGHADVRVATAELYQAMGLPHRARDAYGNPRTLPAWQRRRRRWAWWRAGGPLRRLLWKPRRFEAWVQRAWRLESRHLAVLDTLDWPAGFDPSEIRSGLDRRLQRATLLVQRWWSIRWWVSRAAQVTGAGLTWLALRQFADQAVLTATAVTVVAYVLFRSVFLRLTPGRTWYGIAIAAGLAGAGYAAIRLDGWPAVPGAVLVAAAGMALWQGLIMGVPVALGRLQLRRHWRYAPREDALGCVLAVLHALDNPEARNDLGARESWMAVLELAAIAIERRLPRLLNAADQGTAGWTADRARGAATALRLLKRQVAAPVSGTWDGLAAVLRREAIALATGDLGELRWASPPSAAAIRRSRWRIALHFARTLAFAAAPLVAVIAVQPVLGLDAEPLRWAKVVGLAWAVLYLLLAFDPTLREKVETAQSVGNLFGVARREVAALAGRDPAKHALTGPDWPDPPAPSATGRSS